MQKNTYEYPKSSFLGIQKDSAIIAKKILENRNIQKLLFYTSPDCLSKKEPTSEQIKNMFDTQQISFVPKLEIDDTKKTYIRITYHSFSPNSTNTFYRNNVIDIQIICHYETWNMGNFELRPYRIAGEIDAMLNGARLSGIGLLQFTAGDQILYDDIYGGVVLQYLAIRGEEDKINPLD